jgi:hypothetical protein
MYLANMQAWNARVPPPARVRLRRHRRRRRPPNGSPDHWLYSVDHATEVEQTLRLKGFS